MTVHIFLLTIFEIEWVKRKVFAIFRTCLTWLSADPDDMIARTPINQHTNKKNSPPASDNNTNNATSPADDASFEPSAELADRLLRPVYQDLSLLTPHSMAAKAASYVDQGALQ